MRISLQISLLAWAILIAAAAGCSRAPVGPAPEGKAPRHHHHPPHAGTPVVLGDEAYHVELVLDRQAGTLRAYLLDGEMENFVRSPAPMIEITATTGGAARDLVLRPVPNPVTGETVGDTSLFEAQADWLAAVGDFDGVIRSVAIRGSTYTDIRFNFPRGNDADD